MKHRDYVAFFAQELSKDASLFRQQKVFIESQLRSSRDLFRNMFGRGEEFKQNAREYLRGIGLL
jgi:hypothetical protein